MKTVKILGAALVISVALPAGADEVSWDKVTQHIDARCAGLSLADGAEAFKSGREPTAVEQQYFMDALSCTISKAAAQRAKNDEAKKNGNS